MRLTRQARTFAACAVVLAIIGASAPARSQNRADPGEIRGLKLGLKAHEMSLHGFGELACGSNGGPPRQKLEQWSDFAKCRPEDSNLHEVYARFDDEDD